MKKSIWVFTLMLFFITFAPICIFVVAMKSKSSFFKFGVLVISLALLFACNNTKSLVNFVSGKNNTPEIPVKQRLKIMISVDFEGCSNVVSFEELNYSHPFFKRNSNQLTMEVNAAIEGALSGGATDIVVRDAHSGNNNLAPDLLNPRALYLCGKCVNTPQTMVMGIDSTFDGLIFIGAHAMAGKSNGVLSHTMTENVADFKINGVSLGECQYNALYAAEFGVPVIFVSGDDVTKDESIEFFGNIETVVTKKAVGRFAAETKNPQIVCRDIKNGVTKAVSSLKKDLENVRENGKEELLKSGQMDYSNAKLFKIEPPYTMDLYLLGAKNGFKEQRHIQKTSDSLHVIIKAFWDAI